MGTMALPTAGMNQAGVRWPTSKLRWLIQPLITATVSTPCPATPAIQTSRAAAG